MTTRDKVKAARRALGLGSEIPRLPGRPAESRLERLSATIAEIENGPDAARRVDLVTALKRQRDELLAEVILEAE